MRREKNENREIEVRLFPRIPGKGLSLRWSPKGKKLALQAVNGGFETELRLGPENRSPLRLRLEKSRDRRYFDCLLIDRNKNGKFDDGPALKTDPSESRGKIWSSFETVVEVPAENPWESGMLVNSYPLALWYVENPADENPEYVLRFSRRGWMQGSIFIAGEKAYVLLTESLMDGVYDRDDSWALAPGDEPEILYQPNSAHPCSQHAWIKDQAFRIKEIHPSGRKLVLESFDPGMTREEEERKNDVLAEDREALRSGKEVAFSQNFSAAEALARQRNRPLFIDFETTWCGPCKTMDKLVYTADAVVDAASHFISVKVDGDEHPEIVKRFAVKAYPTMILLSAEGRILKRAVGYQSVRKMVEFLKID